MTPRLFLRVSAQSIFLLRCIPMRSLFLHHLHQPFAMHHLLQTEILGYYLHFFQHK